MRSRIAQALIVGLAGIMVLAASDALARHKKPRHHAPTAQHHVRGDASSIPLDYDGTPIIMQGFHRTRPAPVEEQTKRADRPVTIPRGSSTYIPPPVPSPNSPNSPPAAVLLQPPPSAPPPKPLNSFSDRVTNCIHSFPLQGGIGNNPSDQQTYIRQCAN